MTNEEAIKCLETIDILKFKDNSETYFFTDIEEAIHLAIKALTELKNYQKARNEINQKIISQEIINQETIDWDYIEDGKVMGLFIAESIIAHYVDGSDDEEKYHTCGRCKWENTPYICHHCKWEKDTRKDRWSPKEDGGDDEEDKGSEE